MSVRHDPGIVRRPETRRAVVATTACPRCDAVAGSPCVQWHGPKAGQRVNTPHGARVDAWFALGLPGAPR